MTSCLRGPQFPAPGGFSHVIRYAALGSHRSLRQWSGSIASSGKDQGVVQIVGDPLPIGGGWGPFQRRGDRGPIAPFRPAYCLLNTKVSSPFALTFLEVAVSVLPSIDTVRRVVPTALPPFFKVNSAVLLSICFAERLS